MITENEDAFEIVARDLVVAACRGSSSSSQLELHSLDVRWTITIEGAFAIDCQADEKRTARQIGDLVGESVLFVRAAKENGQLQLALTHNCILTVYPDAQYETWEMHSTRGDRLLAVPGNGLAVWRGET